MATLTQEQTTQYYSEQGSAANPLSPTDWLAKQTQTAAPSTTVPSSMLGTPQQPLPDAPQTPTSWMSDLVGVGGTTGQAATSAQQFTTPQSESSVKADQVGDQIISQLEARKGKAAFTAQAEEAAGLPDIQRNINDLTAQISQLNKESEALKLQYRTPGPEGAVTYGVLSAKDAEVERQRTVKSLTLSAAVDAYQANYASAQQKVQSAIERQFGPIEEEIEYLTSVYDILRERGTAEDKRLAEAQSLVLQERSRLLQEEKETRSQINSILVEAATRMAPSPIINAISSAKTIEEAIRAAGQYLSSPAGGEDMNKLLTVDEATKLGVPYGTTRGQAAALGLTPPADKMYDEKTLPGSIRTEIISDLQDTENIQRLGGLTIADLAALYPEVQLSVLQDLYNEYYSAPGGKTGFWQGVSNWFTGN